jgi:hypothetical protein
VIRAFVRRILKPGTLAPVAVVLKSVISTFVSTVLLDMAATILGVAMSKVLTIRSRPSCSFNGNPVTGSRATLRSLPSPSTLICFSNPLSVTSPSMTPVAVVIFANAVHARAGAGSIASPTSSAHATAVRTVRRSIAVSSVAGPSTDARTSVTGE